MCEDHVHGHAHHASVTDRHALAGKTFAVNDMTCGHCVGTLRAALEQALPGADVRINLGDHLITVSGDAQLAAQAIRKAGYTPELVA